MTFDDLAVGDEFLWVFKGTGRGNTYRKIGHDRYQLVGARHKLVPGMTYQTVNYGQEVDRVRTAA